MRQEREFLVYAYVRDEMLQTGDTEGLRHEKVTEAKNRSPLKPTAQQAAEPDPLTKESFADTLRRVSRKVFQKPKSEKR